jgi:hypothetical protein
MVYFGQEYGERGMDEEGFSGHDGRTTIFDYWSVDTICRAAWNTLSNEEQQTYEAYKNMLAVATKENAVQHGLFFDLMYVNGHLDRQYVFLRKADNELLMVAVNFDERPVSIGVNMPSHAFDYLGIPEKTFDAKDLLTGQKQALQLKKDGCVALQLESNSARVLKIKIKGTTKK